MNLTRIRRDIADAQRYFDYVEGRATAAGGVMALVALQPSRRIYTLGVTFPDSYPNTMPDIEVRKPELSWSPHTYTNGNICYLHPHMWNPGRHDLKFVIQRAAKWLAKYESYQRRGRWLGAELEH